MQNKPVFLEISTLSCEFDVKTAIAVINISKNILRRLLHVIRVTMTSSSLPMAIFLMVLTTGWIYPANSQFTLTGFPYAVKGSTHKVTCSYPGATSYTWTSPRFRAYSGADYTFTVQNMHEGVWQCNATVNGNKETATALLFIYCDGMYVTSTTNYNPSIGDPLELKCNVLSPTGSEVQWMVINGTSAASTAVAAVQTAKCYVYNEPDNRRWAPGTNCKTSTSNKYFNLIIDKARISDDGYWRCYDFGKSGCFSKPVKIKIAKPPVDPPILTGFNNLIVGINRVLYCNAWQPFVRPLTYTWYKNNIQLSSGNSSTWRLRPVTKAAQGLYRCEVVDKVTRIKVKANTTLTVDYVAEWNTAVEKKTVMRVEKEVTANLNLNILVHPIPTSIKLFKDENSSLQLNYASIKMSDSKWVVTFLSVSEKDYGNYTVNVTNYVGTSSFKFQIKPLGTPDVPSDLKVTETGSTFMTISFKAGYDGGAPQTFTIEYNIKDRSPQVIRGIKGKNTNSQVIKYTLPHLTPETTYYVKVTAVNEVGDSDFTMPVMEKTLEEKPSPSMAMTNGEIAGTVVSVLLACLLLGGVIAVVVVMHRKNMGCFAEDCKQQAPVFGDALESMSNVAVTNNAFQGEVEPVYVNQSQLGGEVEPDYVNQHIQLDPDAEVYADVENSYASLSNARPVDTATEQHYVELLADKSKFS